MKFTLKIYLLLLFVFLCSVFLFTIVPNSVFIQLFAIFPGSLSLLGMLFQLIRDEAKYQKTLSLQNDQQMFDIGVTSHMANVAFDKHVLFCEEYVSCMHETITMLYREGPSPEALAHASKLYQIQRRYAVWLTPKIENSIEPFVRALTEIGAMAGNRWTSNDISKIDEMYDIFSDILGIQKENKNIDEQVAVTTILTKLRKVLGIEEITSLRQKLINDNPLIGSTGRDRLIYPPQL